MFHLGDIAADRPALDILAHTEHERARFGIHEPIARDDLFQPHDGALFVRHLDADGAVFVVGLNVYAVLCVQAHREFLIATQNARRGNVPRNVDIVARDRRALRNFYHFGRDLQVRQRFDDGLFVLLHLRRIERTRPVLIIAQIVQRRRVITRIDMFRAGCFLRRRLRHRSAARRFRRRRFSPARNAVYRLRHGRLFRLLVIKQVDGGIQFVGYGFERRFLLALLLALLLDRSGRWSAAGILFGQARSGRFRGAFRARRKPFRRALRFRLGRRFSAFKAGRFPFRFKTRAGRRFLPPEVSNGFSLRIAAQRFRPFLGGERFLRARGGAERLCAYFGAGFFRPVFGAGFCFQLARLGGLWLHGARTRTRFHAAEPGAARGIVYVDMHRLLARGSTAAAAAKRLARTRGRLRRRAECAARLCGSGVLRSLRG